MDFGGERGIANYFLVVCPYGASPRYARLSKFAPGEFVKPGIKYRGFESLPNKICKGGCMPPLQILAEREGFEPSIRY